MRRITLVLAVAATILAVPAAASAAVPPPAKLTVSVGTTPAGDPTPFTIHVTGPACNSVPTDLTFTLVGGQSKVIDLCDSPADLPHRFHVTETVPAGWQLTAIDCTGHDTDPADAFVTDIPSATAFVEFSPGERKACAFQNAKLPPPPAPTPPAPTPPAPGSPAPPQLVRPPASNVAGVQARSPASARLSAQTRCAARTARVTVRGRQMRRVRLSVNGRVVRTVAVARGVLVVRALVPLRRSGPARQRVQARVSFRNGARARTLNVSVRRCAQAAVPQFTG